MVLLLYRVPARKTNTRLFAKQSSGCYTVMDMSYVIPILLGTVRQGRESEKVARFVLAQLEAHPDIETALLDVREMELPMDDEGRVLADKNHAYRDAILKADGLVIVTPEYNNSYPGSLKRALDILLPEYRHRAVGVAGVSNGSFGGARAMWALYPVLRKIGLVAIDKELNFGDVEELFADDGSIHDPETWEKRVSGFIAELLWMSHALRLGREQDKK